jgi:hypothetical protein
MTSIALTSCVTEANVNHLALQSTRWLGTDSDAPCARGFISLLEAFRASGGTAPSGIVSRLLDDHRMAHAKTLAELILSQQVFGFEWRSTLWIPMFQFDLDNLALKNSPQRLRSALPSAWSGWSVASWFATPDIRLEGHTPADALDVDFEAVERIAQTTVPTQKVESAKDWVYSLAQ